MKELKFLSIEEFKKEYADSFEVHAFPFFDPDSERYFRTEKDWWKFKTEGYNHFVEETNKANQKISGIDERTQETNIIKFP